MSERPEYSLEVKINGRKLNRVIIDQHGSGDFCVSEARVTILG